MKSLVLIIAAFGVYFICTKMPSPTRYYAAAGTVIAAATVLAMTHEERIPKGRLALSFRGMAWSVEALCQNFLITGGIGSGKTNAINYIVANLTKNQPQWGGLWLDNKGNSHQDLSAIFEHFGRGEDVFILDVRPRDGQPVLYYNVLDDPAFTPEILAQAISEVTSTESGKNSDFFKQQCILHTTQAIKAMRALGKIPTFTTLMPILTDMTATSELCQQLREAGTSEANMVRAHFESNFLAMPGDQFGGVTGTITNCLQPFCNADVAAVTSNSIEPNGFAFADMDNGAVLCLSLPQVYLQERYALNALFKQLFYQFAMSRYDVPDAEMRQKNPLCLWLDEAQHSLRSGNFGDYRFLDRLRAARCAAFIAMQDHTSCYPTLGKETTNVTLAQLRSRFIYSAPTYESAEISANMIGKHEVQKVTRGVSGGKASISRSPHEEYVLKPKDITGLPNYYCHVVHGETKRLHRKVKLPHCEPARSIFPKA